MMKNFQKEINQNNHHGTIFAFFPFFSQHVSTKNKTQIPASSESVDK